jgi:Rieske Fe-S protein
MNSEDDDCGGCTRRTILQFMAASTLIPLGCRMDDPTPGPGTDPDAPPSGDDAVQGTGFAMCGTQLCVDLAHPNNANLANVGGFRFISMGTTRVAIVRTSATEFATLNARCTHQGQNVSQFDVATNRLRCPSHGSRFELDGTVANGPAPNPLTVLDNTFADPMLMIDV